MDAREKKIRESFLYGSNAPYILDLFQQFQKDPNSVNQEWRDFFHDLGPELGSIVRDDRPPQWGKSHTQERTASRLGEDFSQQTRDSIRALMMTRVYRVRGHLMGDLDPLGLENRHKNHSELDPATYGFQEKDYSRPIFMDNVLGFEWATLPEILAKLRSTYCGTIGVEFMHIQDPDQKAWVQERVENIRPERRVSDKTRLRILKDLIHADTFERFLHVKFPGEKRFGLEGGESLIPALEALLLKSAEGGIESIMFGMAHRGRLGVLANIIHKPVHMIFSKFQGSHEGPDLAYGSGDVKYHLGYSVDREILGKSIHLSLTSNPSHLEAVDPVVLGKVRAMQTRMGDFSRNRAMAVLMHGDAAFCGQGLVAETLELSGLKGYQTGGTVHIIINNQIGFTTSPPHSRSSPYSSDIAKAIQAPIFHVNADDPETVVWATEMAFEFRQRFAQDVVLDMICYRRHGHNEVDEPAFTQPLMYQAIATHPTTAQIYAEKLIQAGLITIEDVEVIRSNYETILQKELDRALQITENAISSEPDWLHGQWEGIKPLTDGGDEEGLQSPTGVDQNILKEVGMGLSKIPGEFNIHPRLKRIIEGRRKMIEAGEGIDWATGEALAIGSLLLEGNSVRLSGQDCGRGTFSQRHAVWIDQETEEKHVPLNDIRSGQAFLEAVDSPLAEASVLGFEYGYSTSTPQTLVIWEAQFGDFANGAQVIIDQFVTSGELKWLRLSGLVMFLPHGFEGQGPEHSSARLERYLQSCGQSNMRVANCSTPANFFHIIRRQIRSETRKPLIIMTPKSILRHPLAVSSLQEMTIGTAFQPVIDDSVKEKKSVTRVIICSGKVYYDLLEERERSAKNNVALVRLEQYYPFPHQHLVDVLSQYRGAEVIWCQEEPKNMGAWMFLDRRLETVLKTAGFEQPIVHYVGRATAASPATGLLRRHLEEQKTLIQQALSTGDNVSKKGLFAI